MTGLAWTQAGGDILFIETLLTRGSGKITITGGVIENVRGGKNGAGGTLIALLGRGDALETSAELPADAAALALGSNAAGLRCLCVGDRADDLAAAARSAGAVPVVPENAADFTAGDLLAALGEVATGVAAIKGAEALASIAETSERMLNV